MVMNMYILFLISLPEAVLNAAIILLISGQKHRLKPIRKNVIKFAITIAAMLSASLIIRPIAQNVIQNVLMHTACYVLIFALVYRLNLGKAALSTFLTILFTSTISNCYYPFIIAYISHGMENFSRDYQLFIVYSLPTRVLQILIIYLLMKHEIFSITRISNRFHKMFLVLSAALIMVEYVYAYMFYTYFSTYQNGQRIINGIMLILLVTVVNFIVFKTIYIVASDFLIKGYSRYRELEEDAQYAFNEVRKLLIDNKNEEAINLIKKLNGEDE